jgi:hypothetical protein
MLLNSRQATKGAIVGAWWAGEVGSYVRRDLGDERALEQTTNIPPLWICKSQIDEP